MTRRAHAARTPRPHAAPRSHVALAARVTTALVGAALTGSVVACGGGAPLLHPARTMAAGDLRLVTGVAANVAAGALSDDLQQAREIAARDPRAPGAPGSSPEYARGALVALSVDRDDPHSFALVL